MSDKVEEVTLDNTILAEAKAIMAEQTPRRLEDDIAPDMVVVFKTDNGKTHVTSSHKGSKLSGIVTGVLYEEVQKESNGHRYPNEDETNFFLESVDLSDVKLLTPAQKEALDKEAVEQAGQAKAEQPEG